MTSPSASMPSSRRRSSVRSSRICAAERDAVVVDDEALARLVLRADDGARGSGPRSRALLDRLEQLAGRRRSRWRPRARAPGASRCGLADGFHHSLVAGSVAVAVAGCRCRCRLAVAVPRSPPPAGTATLSRSPFMTACTAPGHAVLVGAADDLRDLVEVEDRRRRGDLPLERHRAPRVAGRRRAPLPARRSCCRRRRASRGRARTAEIEMNRFQPANLSA